MRCKQVNIPPTNADDCVGATSGDRSSRPLIVFILCGVRVCSTSARARFIWRPDRRTSWGTGLPPHLGVQRSPDQQQVASPSSWSLGKRRTKKLAVGWGNEASSALEVAKLHLFTMTTPSNDIKFKDSIEHIDTLDKPQNVVSLDKFGAATGYTPEEKSLVGKLDTHMMVSQFWNHMESSLLTTTANALDYVLHELP